MCEYMQSMSHSDLKFKRLSDYEGDARAYGAQKSSEVKDFDCRSLLGMYEGVFGPHGLEVLYLCPCQSTTERPRRAMGSFLCVTHAPRTFSPARVQSVRGVTSEGVHGTR